MTSPGYRSHGADPLARHRATPTELQSLLAAERAGVPFVAYRDPGQLHVAPLEDKTTIGRRATADIAIAWDGEVSGLHAMLEPAGGEWAIEDAGSTNGTFVNEERVLARRRLRGGDRIRVGRTVIVFNAARPPEIEPTDLASGAPARELTTTQRRVLTELCRPYGRGDQHPSPPTNQEIADALYVSVDTVKGTLKQLFVSFGLSDLPQGQRRAELAETVLHLGLVRPDQG